MLNVRIYGCTREVCRLVPSRYLSVFWDERRLGIRLRRARGLMVINYRIQTIQWDQVDDFERASTELSVMK